MRKNLGLELSGPLTFLRYFIFFFFLCLIRVSSHDLNRALIFEYVIILIAIICIKPRRHSQANQLSFIGVYGTLKKFADTVDLELSNSFFLAFPVLWHQLFVKRQRLFSTTSKAFIEAQVNGDYKELRFMLFCNSCDRS